MVGRDAQRVEAVPLGLDFGAVLDREPEPCEELRHVALHAGHGLQRARQRGDTGKCHVERALAQRLVGARALELSLALAGLVLDALRGAVQRIASGLPLRLRQLADRAQARRDGALAPEKARPHLAKQLQRRRAGDRLVRLEAERIELIAARRHRPGSRGGLRELDQLPERRRLLDLELCQDLAIHLDARALESGDEAAVRETVLARGGVDARDPQAVELALALAPIAVCVHEAVLDREPRRAHERAARRIEALGTLQNFLVASPLGDAALDSHGESLFSYGFYRYGSMRLSRG